MHDKPHFIALGSSMLDAAAAAAAEVSPTPSHLGP